MLQKSFQKLILTFVAISHCEKIYVVALVVEEHKTKPRVKAVNRHDE